ncbi:NAD(P)-dependent oxidoreductase [Clostridium senegalense]|uniref:NAD(P)-dependent oxidoreductase n=1 Tax=Clostridium senegalense TaxID=1465809 RepID=UPI000289E664|nr:NAD(P)-dependent oxidoreductase [Clostridium senegalense]
MKGNVAYLSLKTNNLKVLIIGGGKAGFIKLKSFTEKGASVKVVSREFCQDIINYNSKERFELSYEQYNDELINKAHIVVIATGDKKLNDKIRNDCENNFKFYIDTTEVSKSLCTMPVIGETENMTFALQTKGKSPKTTLFMKNVLKENLTEYDNYIEFTVKVRNSIKNIDKKKEVMNFIASKDFLYFFNKGYGEEILNLFYGGNNLEISNKKK